MRLPYKIGKGKIKALGQTGLERVQQYIDTFNWKKGRTSRISCVKINLALGRHLLGSIETVGTTVKALPLLIETLRQVQWRIVANPHI